MVNRHDFSQVHLSAQMDAVTQAFIFGRDAERFGKEDACAPLRTKCFDLKESRRHSTDVY